MLRGAKYSPGNQLIHQLEIITNHSAYKSLAGWWFGAFLIFPHILYSLYIYMGLYGNTNTN